MMRAVTIAAALACGLYLYAQGGLPQVGAKKPSGSFSSYTGAVSTAIAPLKD